MPVAIPAVVRRAASGSDPLGDTPVQRDVLATLQRRRGDGEPLPGAVAQDAGVALGANLSAVRVHTGPEADRVTRAVQALAFSYGPDIYFSRGSFSTEHAAGRRLLAHELSHVADGPAGSAGARIGRADAPEERAADRRADRIGPLLRHRATPLWPQPPATDPAPESPIDRIRRITGLLMGQHVLVTAEGRERKGVIANVKEGDTYEVVYDYDKDEEVAKKTNKSAPALFPHDQVVPDPKFDLVSKVDDSNFQRRAVTYRKDAERIVGRPRIDYLPGQHSDFATLVVTNTLGGEFLTLKITILCNPKEMQKKGRPSDGVPVELFVGSRGYPLAFVEPTQEKNIALLEVRVRWGDLLTAEQTEGAKTAQQSALAWLRINVPELTVQASWLNAQGTPDHWMGGPTYKGGSGTRILLRPPTGQEVIESEQKPKMELNSPDQLDATHPVYTRNSTVLQKDSNLVTNLEAEAEYTILGEHAEETLNRVVAALRKIAEADSEALGLDLKESEDGSEKPVTYIDTYYDVIAKDPINRDRNLMMLRNTVVLRHRNKPTIKDKQAGDKKGTNLFAVKGRTRTPGQGSPERIRPAAQVYLTEGTLQTEDTKQDPGQQKQLDRFVSGQDGPAPINAFARVVLDGLPTADRQLLAGDVNAWFLAPALKITSSRRKMTFQVKDGPKIDFSADVATGELIDGVPLPDGWSGVPKATVCSFEFGVGHPGVGGTAPMTSGSGPAQSTEVVPKSMSDRKAMFSGGASGVKAAPPKFVFGRPYHVPADSDNPALLKTADYVKYMTLRDQMMTRLNTMVEGMKTEAGGSKATLLARRMGLIRST